MSKRKPAFVPKTFESLKGKHDFSANIYNSMIESPAFQHLTKNQKLLYLYLKLQYYNPKNRPNNEDLTTFHFNAYLYRKQYKLYSNDKQFYKDRDALITHGFIKVIESGQNTRTKAIYQFSSSWRLYGTDKFEIPACNKSTSMRNKEKK